MLKNIKLVAVDLDGPLLVDTFSPVLYKICEMNGWEYTAEFERNTFSQSREKGAQYIRENYGDRLPQDVREQTEEEGFEVFLRLRKEFMQENQVGLRVGAVEFLERIKTMNITLVCYGGMSSDYMKSELGNVSEMFDRYVCTNAFRPGLKEILDMYEVQPKQALFIDDVSSVAHHARQLGAGFIGVPSNEHWGWQRHDMESDRVPFIVKSLSGIVDEMLQQVDAALAGGNFWGDS